MTDASRTWPLGRLGSLLRCYYRSMAVVALVAAAIPILGYLSTPAIYDAKSWVRVDVVPGTGTQSVDDNYAPTQARAYRPVAFKEAVLTRAIARLPFPETVTSLSRSILSENGGTGMLLIIARDQDPAKAAAIADALGAEVAKEVPRLREPEDKRPTLSGAVVGASVAPATPTAPDLLQGILVATLVALSAAFGQAALRSRVDTIAVIKRIGASARSVPAASLALVRKTIRGLRSTLNRAPRRARGSSGGTK